MRQLISIAALCLALPACDAMPRDAAGTSEAMTRSGVMTVGVAPGTPDAAPALTLLRSYAAAHGATLVVTRLHGEHLQHRLQDGQIQAVVGHFAKKSPWMTDVALSAPVGAREPKDSHKPVLRIARQNGENELIFATDRAVAKTVPR